MLTKGNVYDGNENKQIKEMLYPFPHQSSKTVTFKHYNMI